MRAALLAFLIIFTSCTTPATSRAETDFGRVAMYVAQMLQNNHYSGRFFDDELSSEVLKNYLDFLDYSHLYFTQEDVDRFYADYETTLDDRVLFRDISPAIDIYQVYEERVQERFAKIKELIESEEFTFDSDRTIERTRKDAPWPQDMADADQLWYNMIEANLLEEYLRIEAREKREAERAAKREAEGADDAEGKVEDAPEGGSAAAPAPAPAPEDGGQETEVAAEAPKEEAPAKTPEELVLRRYEQAATDLDENDEEDIANFFLSALSETFDPHSAYFSPQENDNFKISMDNELTGIGALLGILDGAAVVQGLVIGGPAERGGELRENDKIVGVAQGLEGEMVDITFMKLQKIVEMIRGEKGSHVRLEVVPADAEDTSLTEEIIIQRDTVKLKDKLAHADLIEMHYPPDSDEVHRIGWVSLGAFYADMERGTTSTTADIRRLLLRLMEEEMDGLVLDLRGNGGGLLVEAINLTGLFIDQGPVVQTKDRRARTDYRQTRSRDAIYDGPMIVLTDKSSASASEILAAALQDFGRAVIVGEESTFGKGSVQQLVSIADAMPVGEDRSRAGVLKLTIQKYYRIAGGSTQLLGVVPDVILPSLRQALPIGEEALNGPLAYDEIASLRYNLYHGAPLPCDELRTRSANRLANDPEFQWIVEDTERLQARMDENTISINRAERLAETAENKARGEERDDIRRQTAKSLEESGLDETAFVTYKLTLDNVDEEGLTKLEDFSEEDESGMRLAVSDDEEEEDAPFPFEMSPYKLETLQIMSDLIELMNTPATAAEATPAEVREGA